MVDNDIKEKMKEKLDVAVAADFKNTSIKKEINRIKKVDGKFIVDFEIRGLPSPKLNDLGSQYKNYQKIFNDWKELNSYAEDFFEADAEQIKQIINDKR